VKCGKITPPLSQSTFINGLYNRYRDIGKAVPKVLFFRLFEAMKSKLCSVLCTGVQQVAYTTQQKPSVLHFLFISSVYCVQSRIKNFGENEKIALCVQLLLKRYFIGGP
jgi:hypothetical protein